MTNSISAHSTAAHHATTATTTTGDAAATARQQGAVARGDFSALMNLQDRAKAHVAKLRADAAALGDTSSDPARDAERMAKLDQASRIEQLRTSVGPKPGSSARHALADAIGDAEAGTRLTRGTELRVRLALATDSGTVPQAVLKDLRAAIEGIDRAASALAAGTRDTGTGSDSKFHDRMIQLQTASNVLERAMSSKGLDAATSRAIGAAGRQENPGHVVRDLIQAGASLFGPGL